MIIHDNELTCVIIQHVTEHYCMMIYSNLYQFIWVTATSLFSNTLESVFIQENHPQMAKQFRLVKYYTLRIQKMDEHD